VVVAQLIAWSLPIPEDPGSNPVIGNFYETYLLLTVCRKDENKEKRPGKAHFLEKSKLLLTDVKIRTFYPNVFRPTS